MEYKNIHIIYFSPTHTSAKTAYAIAEGLSGDVLLESDITYDAPAEELEIHDDELTIVAAPRLWRACSRDGDGAPPCFPRPPSSGRSGRGLR